MLIGINGKIGSGKGTVASIIQYLTWNPNNNSTYMDLNSWLKNVRTERKVINSGWNVQNSLEDYQFTLNLELFKSNKAQ